ncbi:MAG: methionine synthase [Selenomonadaceae bacterium]|nr:methionine synthase [Selenomonadaceae bacterium]
MPIYNAQILAIDESETRRYAGLRKAQNFGEKNIRDACDEALLLLRVRGAWEIYEYDDINNIVKSEPNFKIVGKSIEKHLSGCEKVICMSVTVGGDIENEVTKKFERGDYLASVLLDAAATAAVEQVADAMEKHFAAMFGKDGFKLRWRFSPGYGNWDLTEQAKLFKICGAEQIGVRLTSSMMLEPRKSVTAIIGLEKITAKKYSDLPPKNCAACNNLQCAMRV